MNAIADIRAFNFPPLEFVIRLGRDRSYVVEEKRGRSGGAFPELSSAILFVRNECRAHRCAPAMQFDQSLAFIRAAS